MSMSKNTCFFIIISILSSQYFSLHFLHVYNRLEYYEYISIIKILFRKIMKIYYYYHLYIYSDKFLYKFIYQVETINIFVH